MGFGKRSPIAIDFGDHAVKVVQLERHRGELQLRDARCVELEAVGGETLEPRRRMLDAARRALAIGSFHGRSAISALRLFETSTHHIRLNASELENLDAALRMETEERYPGRGPEVVCRSIPVVELLERGSRFQERLCCFAENALIEEHLGLLAGMRLEPVGLGLDSCAQLRPFWFYRDSEMDHHAHAYVDIGARTTRITVALGQKPVLMNVTRIGGRHLLDSLRTTLQIDQDEIMEILADDGESVEEDIAIDVRASIVAVLDAQIDLIAARLRECVRYVGTIFHGQGVESIRMLGGAAELPGVAEELARRVGIPVEQLDPFAALGLESSRLSCRVAPGTFATSLGLALRGMES